jgi:hypothetical protein
MESKHLQFLEKHQCVPHLRINRFDYDYYNKIKEQYRVRPGSDTDQINLNAFGGAWEIAFNIKELQDSFFEIIVDFKLISGQVKSINCCLDIDVTAWSEDHYVLMPGAVYNGNRFESRKIAYSPKLLDSRDIGPNKPLIISDVPRLNIHEGPSSIQERSGSMTTPAVGFFDPEKKRSFWLLTEQATNYGDYGYNIIENRDRSQAIFTVGMPLVRELYKYHIADNQFPSDDTPLDVKSGETISLKVRIYTYPTTSVQELFKQLIDLRNVMVKYEDIPVVFPVSSLFYIQESKFNRQNFVEPHGYYAVGMREIFLQDWQIGWTGGMISTYPLLFEGQQDTKNRVLKNFDWLFSGGISPSGFFYDCAESDENQTYWYGGDIRKAHTKNWHLIRKSADALYYIIKQFWLMEKNGKKPEINWVSGTKKVADTFVHVWETWGQFGNYTDSISGEITVGGSTSAALAPAALVYASVYFDEKKYLDVAKASAAYFYENFVRKGFTTGGVGDALQNPDSESAYAMLESFCVLYEQTQDKQWLNMAEEMAVQFSSWVMSYNYEFPEDSLLGKLHIKTRGTVFANTQNKHGAPGICTHSGVALLRLYRATGHIFYLDLLRDIVRHMPQMMSHPDRPIEGMDIGWMSERVSTTDWFEGIGEIMYGSTFSETSLMLTYIEIPGVYVIPERNFVFAFDFVDIKILADDPHSFEIQISNPSVYDITLKLIDESEYQLTKPWFENKLLDANEIFIKATGKKNIRFRKK